ncbi:MULTISPECIES: lipoyl domain-containing protein [Actibacterium]|uniref:Pyruvate/2-oxoglutarate dehydrogenase complex dihydrolipoamide acyltransferase (E2) component n=1 Tax=Actibacterium naphthalenivorans TaxID=1614693 RepID=A0A840C7B6_9RHOB|nr:MULTISPECIES: lipoyl domain-containing protein [Actibacterium]ALG91545.1 biotin attachment protein [Actibacterium sp. EMB200-NS6]MBB4021841.1 pyruvate/2-oxoglutarate dehydrogenase complex dihydrolipoamide acyltransferase (E2) component [Actibacterium naphthalenivorans]
MADILIPAGLWDTDLNPEGIVANWFFGEGAAVAKGDVVAEIMVEKSTFDIEAPEAGVLHRVIPKDGVVRPGVAIGTVDAA